MTGSVYRATFGSRHILTQWICLEKRRSTLKATLFVIFMGIFAMVSPAAAAPHSVDARNLDIAGVKTGMDWNQALTAAAKHFQVSPDDFKLGPRSGENSYVFVITGLNIPSYFTYNKDGINFIVHFAARVPADMDRPLAVEQVHYELPWSQENSIEMGKAALTKYGEQSNAPNILTMEWCANPSTNSGIGCGFDNKAVLRLTQTKLELLDSAWRDEQQKFIDGLKARKPGF